MDKPEQNLFDWRIWDNCQAGLWDVYNRLCVDWGEEHERCSFSTPNLCQSMQESGDGCLDRSIKSVRTGCFKMYVCKLRHNLNILITRDCEVLSTQWVLGGESKLKQTLPGLQQFISFQPCSFWIGWAFKIHSSPLLIIDCKEMWWCSFSFSFRSDTV